MQPSENPRPPAPTGRPFWISAWVIVSFIAGFWCVAFSLAALLGRFGLPFELASHFRMQYLVGSLVCLPGMAYDRRWKTCAALGAAVLLNSVWIAPWYLPAEAAADPAAPTLRVMTVNVRYDNRHFDEVLQAIRDENPDVAVVVETNEAWFQALQTLQDQFPTIDGAPRSDAFGMVVLSRAEVQSLDFRALGGDVPQAAVEFEWQGRTVTLLGVHLIPPQRPVGFEVRNAQLDACAKFCQVLNGPYLVAGDLNLTPYSPYFDDLTADAGVQSVRQGHGILPTYPTFLPLAGIPIDHILHSPQFRVRSVRRITLRGSDHHGISADLTLEDR